MGKITDERVNHSPPLVKPPAIHIYTYIYVHILHYIHSLEDGSHSIFPRPKKFCQTVLDYRFSYFDSQRSIPRKRIWIFLFALNLCNVAIRYRTFYNKKYRVPYGLGHAKRTGRHTRRSVWTKYSTWKPARTTTSGRVSWTRSTVSGRNGSASSWMRTDFCSHHRRRHRHPRWGQSPSRPTSTFKSFERL